MWLTYAVPNYEPEERVCVSLMGFMPLRAVQKHISVPFPGLSMALGQALTQSVLLAPAFLPSSSSPGTGSTQSSMTWPYMCVSLEHTWGA